MLCYPEYTVNASALYFEDSGLVFDVTNFGVGPLVLGHDTAKRWSE